MADEPQHLKRGSRHTGMIIAIVVAVCLLGGASAALVVSKVGPSSASATPTAARGKTHLEVMATDPAPGATSVALDAAVSIHFTTSLAADTPVPTLSPAVAGTWVESGP